MAREVHEAELKALLGVAAIEPGASSDAGLQPQMLERAAALIGCDMVSFSDFDPTTWESFGSQGYPPIVVPDSGAFAAHYWSSACCAYPSTSGDVRTVTTISDFYTLPEFHDTAIYAEYFTHAHVEREIMMCLPAPGGRTRRLLFFRGAGSDFNNRERLLLSLLRPHMIDVYRQLEEARRVEPDLTRRQRELLRLVAAGHTNDEIATRLFISPLTVRKHMENIFERLGVTNRAAAVAAAFPQRAD